MAPTKRVVIPYAPRSIFAPFHARSERFAVGVAHRRAGKTVACINDKVRKAITSPKSNYRAAYLAPFRNQAKTVAWEYLKHYSRPLLAKAPNESELYVELLNGARIWINGADNAEALRGGYLDDATLDEYADMAPSVWGSVIRPMLADRIGSATFIGTPKGRNAFWEIFEKAKGDPDWFTFMLRASETGVLLQTELDASRRDMTPEQYDQEYECSFDAAILGAYYGKELAEADRAGRICAVAYDPALPVHTAWDLGIGDSTAIWFWQASGRELRVIDHYENHGQGLPHYVGVLEARGYRYGQDFIPHDARVRELGTGKTRVETLSALGRRPVLIPQHKVFDGINAARLSMPQVWFDADKCRDGVEALRQYRAEFDEKLRAFKDQPRHDWTSHSADAFRYLAMAWREQIKTAPAPPKPDFQLMQDMTIGDWVKFDGPGKRERAG